MASQPIDPAILKELQDYKAFHDSIIPPGDISKMSQTQKDAIMARVNSLTPEERAKLDFGDLSPAAKAYVVGRIDPATGKAATGVNGQHFDMEKGQIVKNGGFWDLPESYAILAAAAGMGGLAAAPLLAGGAAASAAPEAGAAVLPSTATVSSLGSLVPAGVESGALTGGAIPGATALAGGGSTLSMASKLLGAGKNNGVSDLLGGAGAGVGAAANTAAENRGAKANLALKAQGQFENEMMTRAKEEQSQRNDALKQGYYANYVQNRKPGPFNTAGITPMGSDTLSTAMNLAAESKAKLANAPQYDTNGMPKIPDATQFTDQYGNPTTMEKVGNWLSPTLSTLGKVARYF